MESLTQPDCEPCDPHHYSTAPNGEDHCQRCKSSCPKNSHVVQNCTASTNLICQCRPGHYEYPIDAIETFTECRPHSACPEGAGVRSGGECAAVCQIAWLVLGVCVCVCVCVCFDTPSLPLSLSHTHTHTHTRTHTSRHTYQRRPTNTCIHTHGYIYIYTHTLIKRENIKTEEKNSNKNRQRKT